MRAFIILISAFVLTSCYKSQDADLIIHNAVIYSMDESSNVFEAVAIKDGKIIDIGKENQILNKYSAKESIDAKLGVIFPGFIDSHCHFLGYGLSLNQVNLKGCKSFEEVVERCVEYDQHKLGTWIQGRGWDNTKWENQDFPTKTILDSLFPNTPIYIKRIDGHAGLANQKALNLAGITAETELIGGLVIMDDEGPTGILLDKAMDLVADIIPQPTEAELKSALIKAQENCFAVGLTTVTDAGLQKREVEMIEHLHASDELKMKVYAMLTDNQENFDHYLPEGPYRTERLNVGGFKFYGDGALGSRGACLLLPYSDVPDSSHYGMLLSKPEYFQEKAQEVYDSGFQMCTHCIGDSAARIILNTYGEVLGGVNDKRWRIEHAQIIDSSDFRLFREYSIIPSVQPTHATSDMVWAVVRLGKRRSPFGYAYKDLLDQNGMVALGTDFPIENIDPIETFYSAVARKNTNGMPKNGFQIENALTRDEALKGMTVWGAISNFEEKEKGSLEIGKAADMVILNQNLYSIPEEHILETIILRTIINGETVYEY